MVRYGYARCSTNETKQDINRQRRELERAGVEKQDIFWEYQSGAKDDREQLNILFEKLKPGDEIITTEVSRLTRSMKKMCDIIDEIKQKQVKLVILNSVTMDCTPGHGSDPMTIAMLQIGGVFSQLERSFASERTKSGLANARAKGKQIGRPKTARLIYRKTLCAGIHCIRKAASR